MLSSVVVLLIHAFPESDCEKVAFKFIWNGPAAVAFCAETTDRFKSECKDKANDLAGPSFDQIQTNS